MEKIKIAVLTGDGIGPEVMVPAMDVLAIVAGKYNFGFSATPALVGGIAYDRTGHPLPEETIKICDEADAILFGSVGGPKWADLPSDLTPERGALLPLRKRYNLFINLRGAVVYPGLESASSLKPELIKDLDVLVVRELTGGIYFAEPKWKKDDKLSTPWPTAGPRLSGLPTSPFKLQRRDAIRLHQSIKPTCSCAASFGER